MRSVHFPKEISRIKSEARWIGLKHWRKLGMRLLWASILMNLQTAIQKLKWLFTRH